MQGTKIFNSSDGLIETTVHGLQQDAFLVTQDKMDSFDNYSIEMQMWIALFSIFFGAFLSSCITLLTSQSISNSVIIICWVSLFLNIISIIFFNQKLA